MKKLQFLKAGMESGVSPAQFISINFEDLNYAYLQTAKALHNEITKRATEINGKAYLFFDEIPEVKDWEKCINSLRVSLDCDILHILLADSIIRTAKRFREMKKLQFLKAGMESGVSPAQFISINFEDLNYAYLQTAKALHNEITKRATEINGKAYLFFDEIPEVKDWEKCINSLRVSLDCDIYITGSNAKLLSSELSTYLGGRYVEFIIYPFSFAEFLELYRPIAPDEPIQKCFQKYLLSGTFAPGL